MFATHRQSSTPPSFTKCSLPRLTVGLALLLVGLLLAPHRVQAQQEDSQPYWTQHVDEQVAALIAASNPELRSKGMQLLISLSSESAVSVDFPATRGALFDVLFDRTYADEQRILALSALHAIGGDRTAQMLADRVDKVASDRVRRHLLLALEQHT